MKKNKKNVDKKMKQCIINNAADLSKKKSRTDKCLDKTSREKICIFAERVQIRQPSALHSHPAGGCLFFKE